MLDIEEPEPTTAERASCADQAPSAALWTLSIREFTSVVLKNTSSCQRDLEGMTLFVDDPAKVDCEVSLDAIGVLDPGKSVRVSEAKELAGDTDALAAKLSTCDNGFPLNPDRRGIVYLCRGACATGSVEDMVTYLNFHPENEELDVEALGATFLPEALPSFGPDSSRNAFRYQRVATAGRSPAFSRSDWVLQQRTVFADFGFDVAAELGVERRLFDRIAGDDGDVTLLAEPPPSTESSLLLTQSGGAEQVTTLALALPDDTSPTALNYLTRVSSATATGGHLELRHEGSVVVRLGFDGGTIGADVASGERAETEYSVDTWHHVELRDISWESRKFDLYVDGIWVQSNVEFLAPASAVDELRLEGAMAGVTVGFDTVELWQRFLAAP